MERDGGFPATTFQGVFGNYNRSQFSRLSNSVPCQSDHTMPLLSSLRLLPSYLCVKAKVLTSLGTPGLLPPCSLQVTHQPCGSSHPSLTVPRRARFRLRAFCLAAASACGALSSSPLLKPYLRSEAYHGHPLMLKTTPTGPRIPPSHFYTLLCFFSNACLLTNCQCPLAMDHPEHI